jgi:hypothetical protein
MFTTHHGRDRRRQVARNLTIAVASAALAGGGMAIASDHSGGGSDSPKATSHAGAVKGPPSKNDPLVADARARLDALVAAGTIEQGEADAVLQSVLAGSVDINALIDSGKVSAAHMPAINEQLRAVKQAHDPSGGVQADATKRAKLAAGG